MTTALRISGKPILRIQLTGLPSWNKTYKNWLDKSRDVKNFRQMGARLGQQAKLRIQEKIPSLERQQYLIKTGLLVVKVYPPHQGIMDVFNVNIKAVTDGFTDAEIWADDEWVYVPAVLFMWSGEFSDAKEVRPIRTGKGRGTLKTYTISKVVIEIHELDSININGVFVRLPDGRTK